jgi:hypothetical protein
VAVTPFLTTRRLGFRLWADDDTASRALLGKLGFRYTHDELYAPTGLLHPSYRLDRGTGG